MRGRRRHVSSVLADALAARGRAQAPSLATAFSEAVGPRLLARALGQGPASRRPAPRRRAARRTGPRRSWRSSRRSSRSSARGSAPPAPRGSPSTSARSSDDARASSPRSLLSSAARLRHLAGRARRPPGSAAGRPGDRRPLPGDYGTTTPWPRTPLRGARAGQRSSEPSAAPDATLRTSGALDRAARALAAASEPRRAGFRSPASASRRRCARPAPSTPPRRSTWRAASPTRSSPRSWPARLDAEARRTSASRDREDAGVHHLVLLLSRRRARLDRFPGSAPRGRSPPLRRADRAASPARLRDPPGRRSPTSWTSTGGRAFSGRIRFTLPGAPRRRGDRDRRLWAGGRGAPLR